MNGDTYVIVWAYNELRAAHGDEVQTEESEIWAPNSDAAERKFAMSNPDKWIYGSFTKNWPESNSTKSYRVSLSKAKDSESKYYAPIGNYSIEFHGLKYDNLSREEWNELWGLIVYKYGWEAVVWDLQTPPAKSRYVS